MAISYSLKTYVVTQGEVTNIVYRISSVIRQSFSFQNNPKDLDLSYKTNPKDLDPSYKMDLDLWDCLGSVKLVL